MELRVLDALAEESRTHRAATTMQSLPAKMLPPHGPETPAAAWSTWAYEAPYWLLPG